MKDISIIIPVYNAEKTIERCVESIIMNDYEHLENIEIILIEDCSKDSSWNVCKLLAQKYNNVICVHNEQNRGVSYTRNRGLSLATGQYLMFVDSDDWVDKDYIKSLISTMKNANVPLVICGYVNHDEKNTGRTDLFGWEHFSDTLTIQISEYIQELHTQRLIQQLWNKVFVTEFIKTYGIRFDESISIGEDFRFILDYVKKSNVQEVVLLNKHLYHYMRDQAGSLMYRVGYESIEEPLKNLRSMYEIMKMHEEEIQQKLEEEREKQINLYAYLIFHNVGMPLKEKKKLIFALDKKQGKNLYQKNKVIYLKEKIAQLIRR